MPGRPRRRPDRRQPDARASRVEEDARAPAAHRLIVRALAAALLLIAVACAGSRDPRSDASRLEGVDWVLDDASTGALVDQAPARAVVDLRFQDGQVTGKAACNGYGGDYAADDGSLSFGTFMQTAMACDEPLMALESAYLGALAKTSGFEIADAGLTLTGDGLSLTFTGGGSTVA